MLQSIKQISGCRILATDGEIGHVEDIYFDDEKWIVRYLVVDAGGWLTGRKVLISPYAVCLVDADARAIAVTLTRDQVKNSPDINTNKPVSRREEIEYFRYYGYPTYWPHATNWAWGAFPIIAAATQRTEAQGHDEQVAVTAAERSAAKTHLRSSQEVIGYRIEATDELIGHAEDFLFDDGTWAVRYLVVDTRNWWPGKHVLVGTNLMDQINWLQRRLSVELTREAVRASPEYDPHHPPSPPADSGIWGSPGVAGRGQT